MKLCLLVSYFRADTEALKIVQYMLVLRAET